MKLTPIRVRGKRRQPESSTGTSVEAIWRAKAVETSGLDAQPETRRIKKQSSSKPTDCTGGTMMMSKAIPRILQLPQEVLERVFIASKNLALPLVNRELFRRLSTDSIKYQLVGTAFGPTWHAWYGLDNALVFSYHGWSSDIDRIAGDAAFQSAILACAWAKLPVLLASFDVWIRKHSLGRSYFTVPRLSEERLCQTPEPGSLYDRAYHAADLWPSETLHAAEMTMRQKFAFDFGSFQDFIAIQRVRAQNNAIGGQVYSPAQDYLRALLGMHLEVHPGAAIPNDLLAGPFEAEDDGSIVLGQEKAQRLFWLARGGACLQRDQTWEATRDGFKAILQLITGSIDEDIPNLESEKRLTLATQLFFLFSLLGVFALQWPKYILQTNLGHVVALISMLPKGSKQQVELGEIASTLRVQGRANLRLERYGSQLQHYGSRWQQGVSHMPHNPHRELQLALYRNICASRANLFLRAPNTDERQIASSTESQLTSPGDALNLIHEPWSDFGMD